MYSFQSSILFLIAPSLQCYKLLLQLCSMHHPGTVSRVQHSTPSNLTISSLTWYIQVRTSICSVQTLYVPVCTVQLFVGHENLMGQLVKSSMCWTDSVCIMYIHITCNEYTYETLTLLLHTMYIHVTYNVYTSTYKVHQCCIDDQ